MTEAQGKRGRPRAKIKAGFAVLSSSCGDGAADGQRGRRRRVLGLGERIPQKAAEVAQLSQRERHQTRLAASGAETFFNSRRALRARSHK